MGVTLFVYGTLGPGEPAWPLLEPHATGIRPAQVAGRLYDTGDGYPAAVFDDGAPPVHGWCCVIDSSHLADLDRFEGADYVRVPVVTSDGTAAVAYEWIAALAECVLIPGGRWPIGRR